MKKYIISVLLLSASFGLASAQTADVDTSDDNSCAIITSNLRYLSRDTNGSIDVSILQDFLSTRGYLKSQPTGFFGSATRRAVIAFQNDNGLRATPPGFVGPGTRAKIKEIDCNDTSAVSTVPVTTPVTYNNTPTYTAPVTQPIYTTPAPQITSIDCKGSCNNLEMPINGQSIIHGNYFSGTPSVFLGSTQLQGVQVYNDNTLTLSIPTWIKPGNYNLYVSNKNGTSNTVSVNVFAPITSPVVTPPAPLDTTFQISFPSQGTTLTTNQTYTTSWYAGTGNRSDNYQVYLVDQKGTQEQTYLGLAYQSQGSYTFTIPANTKESVYTLDFRNKGGIGGSSKMFSVTNPQPSITSSFTFSQQYNSGIEGGMFSGFTYQIDNWRNGLVLDIEPTVNCNDMYISPLKRECGNYLFDISGKATEKYTAVPGDPYVKGGALYRITGAGSQIQIYGYVRPGYVATPGATISPTPDSIDFKFIIRDTNQGGKEIWSKTERAQFKG